MAAKISWRLFLALGLLPVCGSAMAAEAAILVNGNSNTEFAWLLGSAVLGFSVVARRTPPLSKNPDTIPKTHNTANNSKHWPAAGSLQ
jgi:hypothetical protein